MKAEDYLKVIIENAGLILKEKDTGFFLDKKNKIGVLYLKKRWCKDIRFSRSDEKEYKPFLYIQEDEPKKNIIITFVIRDSEKSNDVDMVRLIDCNGHDIVLFNNQERKLNMFINDNFFFNGGNIEIRDKDNNQIQVPAAKIDVDIIVNDICNTIVNSEHKTDQWTQEIDGMLEFVKPAIRLAVMNFKEKVNWLIESGLIVPTETNTMKK